MTAKILVTIACLIVPGLVACADEPRTSTPYGILYKEWKADREAIKTKLGSGNSLELRNQLHELNKSYTKRFVELAKEHPKDDLWLDCLIWVGVEGVPGPDLDAMMDLMGLRANNLENKFQLQLFMSELILIESERLNPALVAISEKHPDQGVRGAALYSLAARTKRLAEKNGSIKGCQDAEAMLEKVLADYPDVSTYRGENKKNATRLLDQLRSPVAIAKSAPEMKGKFIDGTTFDLADFRDKVVVLSFSGHWCGPCREMHPIEKELLKKYSLKQLAIIEINSDKPENLKSVSEKMAKDGLEWAVVVEGSSSGPLSEHWEIDSWPTFYVLDRQHQIRRKASGNIGKTLADWVGELVNEKQP